MTVNNEQHIQCCVDQSGDDQKKKRPLRISDRSKDRRPVVIEHKKRHAHKINPHIQRRLINDIIRRSHQFQCTSRKQNTDKCHDHTADHRQRDRSMYCFRHFFWFAHRIKPCRQYICPKRNTDKKIGKNIDQGGGWTNRRQCLFPTESSHYDDVHCIEHQLQNTG